MMVPLQRVPSHLVGSTCPGNIGSSVGTQLLPGSTIEFRDDTITTRLLDSSMRDLAL